MAKKDEVICICTWNHYDCFALQDDMNCDALSDCEFPGRKDCPFYKSKEEVERYNRLHPPKEK